jgi:mannosyltransferase
MGIVETAASLQRIIRSRLKLAEFSLSREGKILLGLVAVGAFLRLYLLGSKSIWLDEAFSISMGQRGLIDLLHKVILSDTHPPLYYLALKFWMILGAGELQVRLLSVLFSIAAIPVMYALVADLYGDKRIGLVGATILAFSPFQVWYAQEARMYAMLTLLVLLSAYFFFRALKTGERRDWIGYVIATALALYTDNGAIWYVVTISIFYLVSFKRFPGKPIDWFLSNAAIGLLYIPWLPFFLEQARQVTQSFWLPAPTFSTVLGTFLDFHSFNFPVTEFSLLYMAVIFVWVTIVPAGEWQRRLGSMWLFIPVAMSLLLSLRQPIFLSRNLIAASLGYYLLITGSIWRFHNKKATLALLLPLLVMNLVSVGYNAWWEQKEDWRGIASYVARSAQKKPGGIIVFIPGYTEIPFSYYFNDYHMTMDTQGFPGDEVLLHPQPKQVGDIAKVLEGRPYVWLVVRDIELVDPNWTVKTWLDTHGYVRQKDLVQESITVITYIRWDLAPKSSSPDNAQVGSKSFLPLIQWDRDLETYQVKPGETLLEIAVRFKSTIQLLMEINDLENPNELTAGQELLVPVVREGTPYP